MSRKDDERETMAAMHAAEGYDGAPPFDTEAEYEGARAALDIMAAETGKPLTEEYERLEAAYALMKGAKAHDIPSVIAAAKAPPAGTDADLKAAMDAESDTGTGLGAIEGAPSAAAPAGELTDTVLDVDRWGRTKGKEIAEAWRAADVADHVPHVVADAHAALFEPEPKLSATPKNPDRAAWWKQLMETPAYKELHGKTCMDAGLSELAAKSICDQWTEYAVENPPEPPGKDGKPAPAPGSEGEPLSKTLGRMRSTAKACAAAGETVDTARDAAHGLGMGGDGGSGFGTMDPKAIADAYNRVKGDDFLRKLMTMAGRMRTLCQSLQRTKTQHGRDDTVGVELSGDVGRLVPSELAQLACGIPELELLALDRVARRQALSRQHRGVEKLGQGPIVVVVDESGSMMGEPVMTAKAIALALAWLAKRQNRWIALVGYTGGRSGMRGYNRIVFAPGKVNQDELIAWLKHFFSGGSDRDIPVKEIPADWPTLKAMGLPAGRTDVIMITDAIAHVPAEMIETYRRWAAAEQARTYGICIGQSDAGDLAGIADRHWVCPDLSGGAAVDAVLSI